MSIFSFLDFLNKYHGTICSNGCHGYQDSFEKMLSFQFPHLFPEECCLLLYGQSHLFLKILRMQIPLSIYGMEFLQDPLINKDSLFYGGQERIKDITLGITERPAIIRN